MSDYGWRQITAPLIVCAKCGKAWYMTGPPRDICIECMDKKK